MKSCLSYHKRIALIPALNQNAIRLDGIRGALWLPEGAGVLPAFLIEEECHSSGFHTTIHVQRQFTTKQYPIQLNGNCFILYLARVIILSKSHIAPCCGFAWQQTNPGRALGGNIAVWTEVDDDVARAFLRLSLMFGWLAVFVLLQEHIVAFHNDLTIDLLRWFLNIVRH